MKITMSLFFTLLTQMLAAQVYQHDNLGRLTRIDFPAGEWITYSYDANGNRIQAAADSPNNFPVEYLEIDAKAINNEYIQLSWKTAVEVNSEYFQIQRSEDGVQFRNIGSVDASGNSAVPVDYSFDDLNVVQNTLYHYRLNQFDIDGSSEFSPIRQAMLLSDQRSSITFVRPNPNDGDFDLGIYLVESGLVSIEAFNGIGQMIYQREEEMSEGHHVYHVGLINRNRGLITIRVSIHGKLIGSKKIVIQ